MTIILAILCILGALALAGAVAVLLGLGAAFDSPAARAYRDADRDDRI